MRLVRRANFRRWASLRWQEFWGDAGSFAGYLPCVHVLGRGHFIISLEETILLDNELLFSFFQGFV